MPYRPVVGVLLGVAIWWFLFMAVGIGIGAVNPEYRAAAAAMFQADDMSLFTTPLLLLNWIVFCVAGLVAGFVAALVSKNRLATLLLAGGFLIMMLINHYIIAWDDFPIWYNLVVPFIIAGLLYLGAAIGNRRFSAGDPETL